MAVAVGVAAGAGVVPGAGAGAAGSAAFCSTGAAPEKMSTSVVLSDRRLNLCVPAAGAVGSLAEGAAALSVAVGLGSAAGVGLASSLVPEGSFEPLVLRLMTGAVSSCQAFTGG